MVEIATKLETVGAVKKKISVEIPAERVTVVFNSVLQKIQKEAVVKGFRKGHVPVDVVRRMFNDEVCKETVERIIEETYAEALKKESVQPVSYPQIELGKFDEKQPFSFSAVFEVSPEITVTNYKSLNLVKQEIKVEEEEVDERLKHLQRAMTQLSPMGEEGVLGLGHIAVVDFIGTADGKKFKGSEAKDFVIDFGVGSILPALEGKLLGMKKNEVRDVEFIYPEDYFNKELAGKKGKFNVTIKELKKKIIPELNDEFARDLGNFATLEDVKKDIREKTLIEKEDAVRHQLYNQVLDKLVETNVFDIPEAFVVRELQLMLEDFSAQLNRQGKTLESSGVKADEFAARYREDAVKRARGYLILESIAHEQMIKVEETELDKYLDKLAARYGKNTPEVRRYFQEKDLIGGLKTQLLHEKTLDFVVSQAKIKLEKPKKAGRAEKKE